MKDEEYYQNLEARFQARNSQLLSQLSIDDNVDLVFPALDSLNSDLPRYSKFRFVAEGGEKTIEAAFDRITQREVAFARPREKGPSYYEHFLKEARLTAYLEHPNIMPVYDIGMSEETPFFTMELVHGEGLGKKRGKGSLANDELNNFLEIFIKVCDAVAFAHSKGVVHLDIKPSNIQTGLFGEVLLSDWGLCRVLSADCKASVPEKLSQDFVGDLTVRGKLQGTPGYMSPSLISGKPGEVADDIYALGATLYYILCGNCPHFSEHTEDILKKTVNDTLSAPIDSFPEMNIPVGLQAIAMKALDSTDPYYSVLELREDIVSYLRGYAPSAEDASLLKSLALLYNRQKALCHTFLGAALLIFLITIFFVLSLKKGQDEESKARLKAERSLEMYENELRLNRYLMEGMDLSLKGIIAEVEDQQVALDIQEILVKVGRKRIDGKTYEAAAQMLETLAEESTGKSRFDALHDLTFTKIFTHDFSGALKLLRSLPKSELRRADLYLFIPLCEEFQHKPKVNGLLKIPDIIKLVNRLEQHDRPRSWFFSHFFTYYLRKCNTEDKVEEFISLVLKKHMHKAWPGARITEESGLRVLSFDDKNNFNRVIAPAILRKLNIDYLDFSGTTIRNFLFLQNLDFKKINLSGTPIKDLNFLLGVPSLKEVILKRDRNYKFLTELQEKGVTIIYTSGS